MSMSKLVIISFFVLQLTFCLAQKTGKRPPKKTEPFDQCQNRTRTRLERFDRRTRVDLEPGVIDTTPCLDGSCWAEQVEEDTSGKDVYNHIKDYGGVVTMDLESCDQVQEDLDSGDLYQALYEEAFDGYEANERLDLEPTTTTLKPTQAPTKKRYGKHGSRRRGIIIGSDDRFEITGSPILTDPEKYVGILRIDNVGICSATLIGNDWILTAAHCVHAGNNGTWFANLQFTPRRNSFDRSSVYNVRACSVFKGWLTERKAEWDMALCKLTSNPGLGYAAFGYNSSLGTDDVMEIRGYPEDKSFGTMWGTFNSLSSTNWAFLYTSDTDTTSGMTGGPWWEGMVTAVHRGASNGLNQAVRITKDKYDWICNLMIDRC